MFTIEKTGMFITNAIFRKEVDPESKRKGFPEYQ